MPFPRPLRTGFLTLGWSALALSLAGPELLVEAWCVLVGCLAAGAIVAGRTGSRRLALAFFVLFLENILFAIPVLAGADAGSFSAPLAVAVLALPPLVAEINLELWHRLGARDPKPRSVCRAPFRLAALATVWILLVTRAEWLWPADASPPPEDRMALAGDIFHTLEERYPHWSDVGTTPDEFWAAHAPRIQAACRGCPSDPSVPCRRYLEAVRDMLADLHNGHSDMVIEGELAGPMLAVQRIGAEAVIVRVGMDSDAWRAGLRRGDVITAVDGRPIASALATVPAGRLGYASERTREAFRYQGVLDGPCGSSVTVSVEDKAGTHRTVRIVRSNETFSADDEEESSPWPVWIQRGPPFAEALMTGTRIGRLTFDGFVGRQFESQIDAALRSMDDPPGIIVDLRDNPGGYLNHVGALLSRLLLEPTRIGRICDVSDQALGTRECEDFVVEPDHPYTGPVAVLINGRTISAAEVAAAALCRSGRARCFGTTSAGETDPCEEFVLPGARGTVAIETFEPAWGDSIYGVGVTPDTVVETSRDDLPRFGESAAPVAAEAWIRDRIEAEYRKRTAARASRSALRDGISPTSGADRARRREAARAGSRPPRARG